jgi:hypothetical protein
MTPKYDMRVKVNANVQLLSHGQVVANFDIIGLTTQDNQNRPSVTRVFLTPDNKEVRTSLDYILVEH